MELALARFACQPHLSADVRLLKEEYENFGKGIERVPVDSKALFLESEKKIWSDPSTEPTLGKSTQVVRSRGCALWRAGQKEFSVESRFAFIGYGKSVTNKLVSIVC